MAPIARTIRHLAGRSLLGLICVSVASAQSAKPAEKKATSQAPTAKPVVPQRAKSPCPDAAYQRACDSYAELVKAKDETVNIAVRSGDVLLVCFRPNEDTFFIFNLSGPLWRSHLDAQTNRRVPDEIATFKGFGMVSEFSNGINQTGTMPVHSFSGLWRGPADPLFVAEQINSRDVDDHSGVAINSSQLVVSSRYKNKLDKNIDYEFIVQRSTGRFIERYSNEKEQIAFLEHQGRCAVPPIKSTQ